MKKDQVPDIRNSSDTTNFWLPHHESLLLQLLICVHSAEDADNHNSRRNMDKEEVMHVSMKLRTQWDNAQCAAPRMSQIGQGEVIVDEATWKRERT
jgi:predicted alpha/beta superfamily hydrolase